MRGHMGITKRIESPRCYRKSKGQPNRLAFSALRHFKDNAQIERATE